MARRGSGQPADIQTRIIKVFEEQSTEFDRGGGSELRVIAWIVNGSEKAPQLERREWWMTEDGSKRAGKAKGFSASDFFFILENMVEIGELMGVPAAKIAGLRSQEPATVGASSDQGGEQSAEGGAGW